MIREWPSLETKQFSLWVMMHSLNQVSMKGDFCWFFWVLGSIICLSAMGLVDSWMYGKWTPVLLNFFRFNFLTSGASFYGRHSWHWYFSQGLPAMAFTFLPFAMIGILWSKQWALAGLIAWVLALYSILGHKEFRSVLHFLFHSIYREQHGSW